MKEIDLYSLTVKRISVHPDLLKDVYGTIASKFTSTKNTPRGRVGIWKHNVFTHDQQNDNALIYQFVANFDNPEKAFVLEENEINQVSNLDGVSVFFEANSIIERAFFRRIFPKTKVVIKPEKADVVITQGKLSKVFYANDKYYHQNGPLHQDLDLLFEKKNIFRCNTNMRNIISEYKLKVLTDDYIYKIIPYEPITESELYDIMKQLLSEDNNLASLAKSIILARDFTKYPVLVSLLSSFYCHYTKGFLSLRKASRKEEREQFLLNKYMQNHNVNINPKTNLQGFINYIDAIIGHHPSNEDKKQIEVWLKMIYDNYHHNPYFTFTIPEIKNPEKNDNESIERFVL